MDWTSSRGNRIAALVQHTIDLAAADDLAHGRLGRLHDRLLGVPVLEQEGPHP
jgi:hypothetical protein